MVAYTTARSSRTFQVGTVEGTSALTAFLGGFEPLLRIG
jgi:hypothetical protein